MKTFSQQIYIDIYKRLVMVIVCLYMHIQTDVCGHTEISTHTTPKMYVSILMTIKNTDTLKYGAASQISRL